MKIAILQLNLIVGDIAGNKAKILDEYAKAVRNGAEMVVGTELMICGYPPKDLLLMPGFLKSHDEALAEIMRTVGKVPLVIGAIRKRTMEGRTVLHNSVFVLRNGTIMAGYDKQLLPTYDVFDELRYFTPGVDSIIFDYGGKRFGLLICEDIWNGSESGSDRRYGNDPVSFYTGSRQVDILLTVNASPYWVGKAEVRRQLVSGVAKRINAAVVYANQAGGNDDLIFDGRSFIVNTKGEVTACAREFEEAVLWAEVHKKYAKEALYFNDLEDQKLANEYKALVMSVYDYCAKCGFKKAIVGLSGGIDSALTAEIAVDALGAHNVIGVTMPSAYNSSATQNDAMLLAKNLGISFASLPISGPFNAIMSGLNEMDIFTGPREGDVTEENVQARIRGVNLMALANRLGGVVLSTGNKSELAMGYCTLYGDMVGGYNVLGDVLKTDVFELARYRNTLGLVIPVSTIERPPSAELRPDQKDEDTLPPYSILDAMLNRIMVDRCTYEDLLKEFDKDRVDFVWRRLFGNEYKRRQSPVCPKLTKQAFGGGWRMPIACKIAF